MKPSGIVDSSGIVAGARSPRVCWGRFYIGNQAHRLLKCHSLPTPYPPSKRLQLPSRCRRFSFRRRALIAPTAAIGENTPRRRTTFGTSQLRNTTTGIRSSMTSVTSSRRKMRTRIISWTAVTLVTTASTMVREMINRTPPNLI